MTLRRATGYIVPAALFVVLLLPLRAGFTDDGYIHIQYAGNIVERGEYSFNPGHVSFGTTSPIWVLIQSGMGMLVGTGEALIGTSRFFSWLAGVAAVVVMFFFARTFGLAWRTAFLCALMLASHAWMVRWTALGMETSTAVLAIALVGWVSRDAGVDPRRALLLGFSMAIAALVRPEAYLLVPVYLISALIRYRATKISCVLKTLVVYASLILPWLVFAKLHIGHFLPNTAGAKSGGLVLDPVLFLNKWKPIVKIVMSAEAVPVALVLVALVIFRLRSVLFTDRFIFLLLWVVALPFAYVVFDIQVLSRYMLLSTPFVLLLGLASLEQLMSGIKIPVAARAVSLSVAGVAILTNIVFFHAVILKPSQAFSHDLTHNLKELGLYINANTPADAVVAAADIGYLAFYSQRHVLDLGGLVDDVTAELCSQHPYEEIVQQGLYLTLPEYPRVDYLIDRVLEPNRFAGKVIRGHRFESIKVDQVRNLGIRKPGPYYYTLYRLHRVGRE